MDADLKESLSKLLKQYNTMHKERGDHDERYLQLLDIINNSATTEEGYALDARQANPNISGSMAETITKNTEDIEDVESRVSKVETLVEWGTF